MFVSIFTFCISIFLSKILILNVYGFFPGQEKHKTQCKASLKIPIPCSGINASCHFIVSVLALILGSRWQSGGIGLSRHFQNIMLNKYFYVDILSNLNLDLDPPPPGKILYPHLPLAFIVTFGHKNYIDDG